jgi:endonuclease YncB( thermonuclease family)
MIKQRWLRLSALSIAFTLLSSSLHAQSTITGPARVIDGDSIEIAGISIRLFGLDAPEKAQACLDRAGNAYACGLHATVFLIQIIQNRDVSCEVRDIDRYRRRIAVCFAGETNLNSALVRNGWAVAYRRYSAEFVPDEEQARRERKGMWAGRFNSPEDWRQMKR